VEEEAVMNRWINGEAGLGGTRVFALSKGTAQRSMPQAVRPLRLLYQISGMERSAKWMGRG
jgi:hypothetical protein